MILKMKYGFAALILLILASCSSPETAESVRLQIAAHKKEVLVLNRQIADLEKKLSTMDPGESNSRKVAVIAVPISYQPFEHFIQVSGTAEAVNEAFISSELSGQIREIYVREGDYVRRGQPLMKLNSEITETNIADLQASLELAATLYEKQQRLWEKGIGSEVQYLNAKNSKESLELKLETLKAQLDMAMIKSPVNGIVDEIYRKNGELAVPGVQLMQIVNLEELYINADVSESYLGQIREGDMVKAEFPVYPGMVLEVPIFRKGNVIKPGNRTFTIQLRIKNPEQLLKPNILSRISIRDFSADSAIVVSSSLIKQDITGSYLYVLQQDDNKLTARKVYITPGQSYLDKTMVTGGLQEGQQVIVEGYNLVSDGSEVYTVPQNASQAKKN